MVSGKQAICRELHPPTGVTQCCSAFFTHVAGKGSVAGSVLPNLVIVRATLLQIYTVRASKDDSNESESARLEEVAHYKLAGVVESLAVLRSKAVGVQCDALLLTFRDAKLAVLDWNEESDTIATSSLHYFEGDAALKGGWTVFPYGPRVICDPQGRCAAVTFFRNQLAILPAMDTDDLLLGDGGANAGPAMSTTVGNSYVVSGKKLGFNEVRDSVFLHRYNEPVLLVLYETEPTWPGRYRDKKDTMALVAFSMNVVQKRHARIWSAANLPSDAYKLVPVPLGGVLVLCQNMILYHTQGASCALVVNSNAVPGIAAQKLELIPMVEQPSETAAKHARKYATNVHPETVPAAALHAPRAEGFEIELDAANAAWLSDTTLLLALKTGQLVLVNLHMESSVVCRIQLTKAGAAPPTSSACSLGQGLVMLGSWLGDSLLIRAIPQKEPETPLLTDKPEIKLLTGGKANGGPAAPAAATAAGAAGAIVAGADQENQDQRPAEIVGEVVVTAEGRAAQAERAAGTAGTAGGQAGGAQDDEMADIFGEDEPAADTAPEAGAAGTPHAAGAGQAAEVVPAAAEAAAVQPASAEPAAAEQPRAAPAAAQVASAEAASPTAASPAAAAAAADADAEMEDTPARPPAEQANGNGAAQPAELTGEVDTAAAPDAAPAAPKPQAEPHMDHAVLPGLDADLSGSAAHPPGAGPNTGPSTGPSAGPSTAATPGTKRRAEDSGRDQHSFAVGSGTPAGPPGIGPDAGNGRELKRRRPNEAGGVTGGSVAGTPANGKVGAGRGAGATPGRPGTVTKQRLEGTDAAGLGDASDTDEEDALVSSIYDVDDPIAMTTTTSTVTHYKLQTLDTLIGLAPIHDMVVGDPLSSAPSEWGQESTRGPQQLVACVGHDRAGCLAVLRRGLIPELITEVPLPGVQGLWAVHYRVPDAMEDANSHTYHAFLLLSAATETKVLETGEELQERNPTEIDFVTDSPTVFAGNVIGAAYIVQVYPLGIRVLRGTDYVEDTPIGDMLPPSDDPAVQASQAQIRLRDACIADPYLLLHLTDGTAAVYTVDLETGELEDVSSANQVLLEQFSEQGSDLRVTACSLYTDHTGWLARHVPAMKPSGPAIEAAGPAEPASGAMQAVPAEVVQPAEAQQDATASTDVSAGAAGAAGPADTAEAAVRIDDVDEDGAAGAAQQAQQQQPAGVYCLLHRRNGQLHIYSLPDMQLVFAYMHASQGPSVLLNGGVCTVTAAQAPTDSKPNNNQPPSSSSSSQPPVVDEVRMDSFPGSEGAQPVCERPMLLMLISDGSLLAYRAFSPASVGGLRFARLPLGWVGNPGAPSTSTQPQGPNFGNRLTRFDCLGEQFPYSGVFVAGPRPVWLIASRGRYVGHAMEVEGQVASMTPFHNVNCPQGFITAAGSGQDERLKICQLPIKVRLDTAWPLQKVALRATPHAIAYYPQAKLYALLVSRQVHYRPRIPEEPGGDEHAAYAYALSDAAAKAKGVERGSEIRLVRSGMFSTLWRHALNPGEDALCIKALQLRNFASGETEPLLAVGTACCLGEDYPCLGRLLFLRVARRAGDGAADLDAGDGEADWEARVVYTREFRGPVVAVDSLEGYLVIAFGARLETHQWMGSTLSMAAFFNAPMLITSLNIIKNFILLGDVHKGAYFIQFTDAFTQLKDISKDFHNADICATEFLINARKLTLLAADAGQNIRLLSYEPGDPRTGVQGKMLLYEGVFHVGHLIAKFLPQPMRITAAAPATQAGPNPKRQAAVYGTLDGSLGVVAPAWDPAAFAVLAALQKALWTDAEHPAGLNPHAFRRRFRKVPFSLGGGQNFGEPYSAERILDGDLLARYVDLPRAKQAQLAVAAGAGWEQLLALLFGMAAATSFF